MTTTDQTTNTEREILEKLKQIWVNHLELRWVSKADRDDAKAKTHELILSAMRKVRRETLGHLIYVFEQVEPNADKERVLEYINKLKNRKDGEKE